MDRSALPFHFGEKFRDSPRAQTGRIMVIDIGYQETGKNMPDMVQN